MIISKGAVVRSRDRIVVGFTPIYAIGVNQAPLK